MMYRCLGCRLGAQSHRPGRHQEWKGLIQIPSIPSKVANLQHDHFRYHTNNLIHRLGFIRTTTSNTLFDKQFQTRRRKYLDLVHSTMTIENTRKKPILNRALFENIDQIEKGKETHSHKTKQTRKNNLNAKYFREFLKVSVSFPWQAKTEISCFMTFFCITNSIIATASH